jgi:hypothetical protein
MYQGVETCLPLGFPLKKKEDIHVMNQKHPVLYHMTYCFKMGRGYNTPTFICRTGAEQLPPDKHSKDIPFLEKYALERWEVITFILIF